MAQVIAHSCQLRTVCKGERRVGLPHPARSRPAQLVREWRIVIRDSRCGLQEEPTQHSPQPDTANRSCNFLAQVAN